MKRFRRTFRFLSNKYVYTTLAFIIWVAAFDRNNLVSQYKLTRDLKMLKHEKDYYLEEIHKDSVAMAELMSSLENLEKFGRERYLMKKDEEDIFLILRDVEEEDQ